MRVPYNGDAISRRDRIAWQQAGRAGRLAGWPQPDASPYTAFSGARAAPKAWGWRERESEGAAARWRARPVPPRLHARPAFTPAPPSRRPAFTPGEAPAAR